MTAAPDPEMKARAESAAARTADAICKWCDLPPRGALWDAVYEAAVPANLDMLRAQREDDHARLIAKVAPAVRGV
jgi:hypothetical protein